MKTPIKFFTALLMIACVSCGPSAEEKARAEKARLDSVENATKKAMEMKQTLESQLQEMSNALTSAKADLDVANSDMNKIQEFHLLRTDSERDQQVHDQSIKIQNLQKDIATLEQNIGNIQERLSQVNVVLNSH
jgi:TolA-binding protein